MRVSLESLYVLPKNEWQVEESAINFANKKILQKFSNNRFMWSELANDSVWRVSHRGETMELRSPQLRHHWTWVRQSSLFLFKLELMPLTLVYFLPVHMYTCLFYVCCMKSRLFSEKWFLCIPGPFHNKQRCQKSPGWRDLWWYITN